MAECDCRAEVAIDYSGPPETTLAKDVTIRSTIVRCPTHDAAFRLVNEFAAALRTAFAEAAALARSRATETLE